MLVGCYVNNTKAAIIKSNYVMAPLTGGAVASPFAGALHNAK
jgi:hypothetical protein